MMGGSRNTLIQGVLEERLKTHMITYESGTMEDEKRMLELNQETPTQTLPPDPDLKKPHHGGESWDQLGEHCARVFDTCYSTKREMESYASYEIDDESLFNRETVQKASQNGLYVEPPYQGRSSFLQ